MKSHDDRAMGSFESNARQTWTIFHWKDFLQLRSSFCIIFLCFTFFSSKLGKGKLSTTHYNLYRLSSPTLLTASPCNIHIGLSALSQSAWSCISWTSFRLFSNFQLARNSRQTKVSRPMRQSREDQKKLKSNKKLFTKRIIKFPIRKTSRELLMIQWWVDDWRKALKRGKKFLLFNEKKC